MEIQTFAQIWLKYQDVIGAAQAHHAMSTSTMTGREVIDWKEMLARHARKIKYYKKKLSQFGQGTIIEITGKIFTSQEHSYGTVHGYHKDFILYLSNITMEDAKTLVKFKYKNIDLETISIKEIHCGVLTLN